MATPVLRTEKELLLKMLYNEQPPLIYVQGRNEYALLLEQPAKEEMVFHADNIIPALKPRDKLNLIFDYRGQPVSFTVTVTRVKEQMITCDVPEVLYKDLDRGYSRVNTPPDLEVRYSFLGEYYNLSFPKVAEYEAETNEAVLQKFDLRDLSGLIRQMGKWIRNKVTDYRLVIFKNTRPTTIEERIVAETGKTLYLPSTHADFPANDPHPRKRLITGGVFRRYLESAGVEKSQINSTCVRFIRAKYQRGILSDAWIPILFQHYVIGYIHVWLSAKGEGPLDYRLIDTLYQFAAVLSYSFKINGFFEDGKVADNTLDGKVIDISASGLLFACPHSSVPPSLLPNSGLPLHVITPQRSISTEAKIVRRFRDASQTYFGCRFENLNTDDLQFLFEFIYGKPFTEFDAGLMVGQT